jgi:TRAP-type C4-dicarboxylate transport system substrate-binding protein
MRTLTRITTAAALILAMTSSMMFATAHAESSISVTQSTEDGSNSLRVTQSTENGLEVECEGNLNCEIRGDDTVVASSKHTTTTTTSTAATTSLNQSNITEFSNDFDVVDEQDLGAKIEGMVDRLLDEISGKLANLAISI